MARPTSLGMTSAARADKRTSTRKDRGALSVRALMEVVLERRRGGKFGVLDGLIKVSVSFFLKKTTKTWKNSWLFQMRLHINC